jgi:hypothetical protein
MSMESSSEMGQMAKTDNKTGFDFGVRCFKWEVWTQAYDGELPLLDVGAGLGEIGLPECGTLRPSILKCAVAHYLLMTASRGSV